MSVLGSDPDVPVSELLFELPIQEMLYELSSNPLLVGWPGKAAKRADAAPVLSQEPKNPGPESGAEPRS